MSSILETFKAKVERFLTRHRKDLTATQFGKLAMSDPNFVFDMRNGRKPNTDTIESVVKWMRNYDAAMKLKRSGGNTSKSTLAFVS